MRPVLKMGGCLLALLVGADVASAQAVVRGEVVDDQGAAVEGVSINFYDADNERTFTSETEKDGRFLITVRPGQYQITIEKDGYRGVRMDRQVRRAGMELERVEIVSAKTLMDAALAEVNQRFALGAQLANEGKLDEAQAVFEALIRDRPELPDVHYNLGLLLIRKDDLAGAEAALGKALELRPDHAPSSMALAGIYADTGRGEEAAALAQKVVAANPDDADIQVEAAYLHLNADRPEEAKPFLERALELAPENAEVHYLLGTVLAREGEFGRAVELLERYLELAPADDRYREPAESMLPQLKELLARQQEDGAGAP